MGQGSRAPGVGFFFGSSEHRFLPGVALGALISAFNCLAGGLWGFAQLCILNAEPEHRTAGFGNERALCPGSVGKFCKGDWT